MFIFDINGTLTTHNSLVSTTTHNYMKEFLSEHPSIFITGVGYGQAYKKVGGLANMVDAMYCLSGNEKWVDGELEYKNHVTFDDEDIQTIRDFGVLVKYEDDTRLNVNVEFKNTLQKFELCDKIEQTLPHLSACIATNSNTIAVHRTDRDKRQILQYYPDAIYVTDTIDKYSYDYYMSQSVKTIKVNGPHDIENGILFTV